MNIPHEQISRWIVDYLGIWQMDFLDSEGLYKIARDKSVDFWVDNISKLWQLGWIRADFLGSQQDFQIEGIQLISEDQNGYKYFSDNRSIGIPQQNIEDLLRSVKDLPEGLDLYFHPFKYYTLYQIQRAISTHINPFQIFIQSRFHNILEREIQEFNNWISDDQFSNVINGWNDIATLAIATEPCYFTPLFGFVRLSPRITYEQHIQNISEYRSKLSGLYRQLDLDSIKQIIGGLCANAEFLDPNKQLHTLLRFLDGSKRLELKGNLGGAILLKSMAEIIKRMTEWVSNISFSDEEEMWFGFKMPGKNDKLYDSKRILTFHIARKQIIREMGLDPGIRIRWYVEGQTEYYALIHLLSEFPQIEVINLSGQVAQRAGKGVAFRDNLILDERSQVFSYIFLDGDKEDNVRVVRKAAEEDIFCGFFYIAEPDFEMANFTKDELENIIWSFVDDSEKNRQNREILHEKINDQVNCEGLLRMAKTSLPSLSHLGKGKEWGERLAEYARMNPNFSGKESLRPIIEGISRSIRCLSNNADFQYSRIKLRVDPNSGILVNR